MKKLIFLFALGMILLAGVGSAECNVNVVYDEIDDSSLNTTLWQNIDYGGGEYNPPVTENNDYIQGTGSVNCGTGCPRKRTGLRSIYLPDNTNNRIYNLTLRTYLAHYTVSGGSGSTYLQVFGNTLMSKTGTSSDTTIWNLIRINSTHYAVYDDGVNVMNITPTNNNINMYGDAVTSNGQTASYDFRLYYVYYYYQPTLDYVSEYLPLNNSDYLPPQTLDFNITSLTCINQLTNISLYLNGILNETQIISGTSNNTIFTKTFSDYSIYNWTTNICDSENNCFFSSNKVFSLSRFVENSLSYNSTTYETASETFILNTTLGSGITSSSATFYYNGTNKGTATKTSDGTNTIFTSTIDIPSGTGSKDFYWTLNLDGELFNTTTNTQTVSQTLLGLCNATLTTKYINYTFKDELTLANINGSFVSSLWEYYLGGGAVSKTLSFINATENPSYAFCLIPTHPTLKQDTIIQYASTGYPQRRYFTTGDLTNTTTNTVLYLLGSSDGIYSAIQVTNLIGSPIQDVTVTIEKQIGGVWTVLRSEQSDGSGLVTFWVDPNSDHRITAGKTGYLSTTQTIRPTQTTYTIILAQSTGNVSFQSDLEGLKWQFRPSAGIVQNGTAINFNVTITAEKENLVSCQFSLMNSTGVISSTTSSCSSGSGFLSLTYTPSQNEKVYGIFYVDVGNGLFVLDGDAYWIAHNTNISQARTLRGVLKSMAQLNEFGEGVEQEFSRIVFFFFALAIGMGLICYFTGYDLSNPGFTISILFGVILFASISGWFQYEGLIKTSTLINEGAKAWLNKYIYSVTIGFLFCGWLLNQIRRTQ